MINRFKGWSHLPGLVVLAALFARVDVATKALHGRLQRYRDFRALELGRFDAFRVSGLVPIAGGVTLTEGPHTGEALASEAPGTRSREQVTVLSGQNLKACAVVGRVALGIGRVNIPTVTAADGGAATGNGTASKVFVGRKAEVGSYVVSCITAVTHGGVFSVTTPSGKRLPDFTMTPGSGGATDYTSDHINFTITDSTDFAVGDKFTFVVSTTAPTVIGGTGTGTISALSVGPDAKPGNYRVIVREAITNGGRFEVLDPDGISLGDNFLLNAGSTNTTAFATDAIRFSITDATDFIAGNYFDVAVFNQLAGGKVVAWDPKTFDGRHRVAGMLLGAVDASAGDVAGVLIARDAVLIKGPLQWGAAISAAEKEMAYTDLAERLGIVARDSVN